MKPAIKKKKKKKNKNDDSRFVFTDGQKYIYYSIGGANLHTLELGRSVLIAFDVAEKLEKKFRKIFVVMQWKISKNKGIEYIYIYIGFRREGRSTSTAPLFKKRIASCEIKKSE